MVSLRKKAISHVANIFVRAVFFAAPLGVLILGYQNCGKKDSGEGNNSATSCASLAGGCLTVQVKSSPERVISENRMKTGEQVILSVEAKGGTPPFKYGWSGKCVATSYECRIYDVTTLGTEKFYVSVSDSSRPIQNVMKEITLQVVENLGPTGTPSGPTATPTPAGGGGSGTPTATPTSTPVPTGPSPTPVCPGTSFDCRCGGGMPGFGVTCLDTVSECCSSCGGTFIFRNGVQVNCQ